MSPALKIGSALAAYVLGSVPFGYLMTRLLTGEDVRRVGSGNIGASNVARAAGKVAAVITLFLDAGKAAVPMLIVSKVFERYGHDAAETWTVVVGLAAFAGHLYPLWLRFHGGKGVATALGVFLVLAPIPALLAMAVFGIVLGLTRVPAVGSLCGTVVCCVGTFVQELVWHGRRPGQTVVPWAGLALAIVIVLRHRANIARLLRRAENRV